MDGNITNNNENLDVKDTETKPGTDSNVDGADEKDQSVTYTEDEVAKKIQSAEDKLRTKYSKQIKELEDKVKELSPVEKSETEIAMEKRIAALEESEKAVAAREKKIAVQEKLSASGLDKALADYIRDDVDIDALTGIVDSIVKSKVKSSGYVPNDHGSDDDITPEEYKKMTYSQKQNFMEKHPDAYKRLKSKI